MSGSLTHSQADIIRQLLVDLSAGTLPSDSEDWPIQVNNVPNKPDNLIAVFDTTGRLNGRSQIDGQVSEHHGFMIEVRGTTYRVAYAKANTIKILLDETIKLNTVTIGSNIYTVYAVSLRNGPNNITREDDSNRFVFTINAVVALRQTT